MGQKAGWREEGGAARGHHEQLRKQSFVRGRRWLVPYSPLRGCAELAALATAKIPRRRPPANFKTGSERMKANLKEQRNWTETAFEVERDERSGWALWNGAKWRREKRPRKTKRIMNEDRLLPPHPCPLPEGEGESLAALSPIQSASTRCSVGCGVPSPCGSGRGVRWEYQDVFKQCFQGFPLSPALPARSSRGEDDARPPPLPLSPILRTP